MTYEEVEKVEYEESVKLSEMELGLKSLVDRYGYQKVTDALPGYHGKVETKL